LCDDSCNDFKHERAGACLQSQKIFKFDYQKWLNTHFNQLLAMANRVSVKYIMPCQKVEFYLDFFLSYNLAASVTQYWQTVDFLKSLTCKIIIAPLVEI